MQMEHSRKSIQETGTQKSSTVSRKSARCGNIGDEDGRCAPLQDVPLWVTRIRRRLKDNEDGPPPIDLDDTDISFGVDLLFDNNDRKSHGPF